MMLPALRDDLRPQPIVQLYFTVGVLLLIAGAGIYTCRGATPLTSIGGGNAINLGIAEIVQHHRITSSFLPVAYPGFLGWSAVAAAVLHRSPEFGICAAQILILLALFFCTRTLLARFTSWRYATIVALLITLYPQYLWGVKSLNDGTLTLVTMMVLVIVTLDIRDVPNSKNAILFGLSLGAAVLVRPSLALLAVLFVLAVMRKSISIAARLGVISLLSALILYCVGTAIFHGRPFFPKNGPYNLYAGFNPYSERYLVRNLNAEESLPEALALQGITARQDWNSQSDDPAVNDTRDLKYAPLYKRETKRFILEHPGEVVHLTWVKFRTLFSQNYSAKGETGGKHRVAVILKHVTLLVFPLWVIVMLIGKITKRAELNDVVIWTILLWLVPFILSNVDPRFRITCEGLVLADIARMIYALKSRDTRIGQQTQSRVLEPSV
jgi:4-amino-4-deoxy-L-arabinose transferase-like glycosyltransferase